MKVRLWLEVSQASVFNIQVPSVLKSLLNATTKAIEPPYKQSILI